MVFGGGVDVLPLIAAAQKAPKKSEGAVLWGVSEVRDGAITELGLPTPSPGVVVPCSRRCH